MKQLCSMENKRNNLTMLKLLPKVPTTVRKRIQRWMRFNVVKQVECLDKGLLKMHPTVVPHWIGAKNVPPHNDADFFGDKYFLNLTLSSDDHIFGNAKYSIENKNGNDPEGFQVPVGTIFKTDPRVVHWLFCSKPSSKYVWIGVQWDIPRRSWKKDSQIIVKNLVDNYQEIVDKTSS